MCQCMKYIFIIPSTNKYIYINVDSCTAARYIFQNDSPHCANVTALFLHGTLKETLSTQRMDFKSNFHRIHKLQWFAQNNAISAAISPHCKINIFKRPWRSIRTDCSIHFSANDRTNSSSGQHFKSKMSSQIMYSSLSCLLLQCTTPNDLYTRCLHCMTISNKRPQLHTIHIMW